MKDILILIGYQLLILSFLGGGPLWTLFLALFLLSSYLFKPVLTDEGNRRFDFSKWFIADIVFIAFYSIFIRFTLAAVLLVAVSIIGIVYTRKNVTSI